MRASLRIGARLGAAALIVAASLPGPLQLAHEHAGGGRPHVHLEAERLAAHDLFAQHHERHAHPHRHPHAAEQDHHTHAVEASPDGPALRASGGHHVHALDPFQQTARTTVLTDAAALAARRAHAETPPPPASRPRLAARSRGPPAPFVG